MRQILTTVGELIEAGKSINENECRVYSFLEIRTDGGQIDRINNAIVHNECARGVVVGQRIAMLYAYTENAVSNAFPNAKGLSYVYAVANQASGRQFNDVEELVKAGDKMKVATSIGRWIWGLLAAGGALYGLVQGGIGGAIGGLLFGLVFGGMVYLMKISGMASAAPLYATRDEIEPEVGKLAGLLGSTGAA
ncbi:hypothetical protein ACG02S_21790 [Roseateles sp. DC23W]|uniref:Uncharacterized protein n=1 Tax=Pelomonas dachongensis TaxID=3299029 RepID=A0ABW7ESP9_9BURK